MDPFTVVTERLDGVRGARPKVMARCPAHADRCPSLSVGEAQDGKVLLKCFTRNCSAADIVMAVGLTLADLYPQSTRCGQTNPSRWPDFAGTLATAPARVVDDALEREIEKLQAREAKRVGHAVPLTSRIENVARATIGRRFSRTLARVEPRSWERCFPLCEDPWWPVLFQRALDAQVRGRWHYLNPDAETGATDPRGANAFDILRAEEAAARELRRIAAGVPQ